MAPASLSDSAPITTPTACLCVRIGACPTLREYLWLLRAGLDLLQRMLGNSMMSCGLRPEWKHHRVRNIAPGVDTDKRPWKRLVECWDQERTSPLQLFVIRLGMGDQQGCVVFPSCSALGHSDFQLLFSLCTCKGCQKQQVDPQPLQSLWLPHTCSPLIPYCLA